MERFNQNLKPSLTEVLGELLPVYDLGLYEELGRKALNEGRTLTAIEWFTKGLSMARELRNPQQIDKFKWFLINSLQEKSA